MRRIFVVLGIVLSVGIVLGLGSRGIQPNARAAGGGGLANENGDINGDGTIDLTDAVGILFYLFQDGAPPVAIADSPDVLARISALEEKANLIGILEQRLAALEGVPAGLSELQGRVGTLEQELQRLPSSGEIVFFAWNAAGVPQRSDLPNICVPGASWGYLLNFPLDSPTFGRPDIVGGTIDGTAITFTTRRPGHLLISLRAMARCCPPFTLHALLDDRPPLSAQLDSGIVNSEIANADLGPRSSMEVAFLSADAPAGQHVLRILSCTPLGFEVGFESLGMLGPVAISVQYLSPNG